MLLVRNTVSADSSSAVRKLRSAASRPTEYGDATNCIFLSPVRINDSRYAALDGGPRNLDPQQLGAVFEPVEVRHEIGGLAIEYGDRFEQAIAEGDTTIERIKRDRSSD